ncbi:DUF3618 domain-containing protein [Cellulomonas edaphi]|uniref:DUF3618 domain-containing protein n=1 Tax=Cellulomonas edaphi TaxID=3053468 RepID=A0ABT7S9S3_9CELL|nr:DUF3618 domain-containing protein [Cellulomons edaphi]MDM7832364.1 DUF3618 domain-containing protein [Cellulomons edaphi]
MSEQFSTPQMVKAEAEIALVRSQLAASVDALAQRLTPRALANDAATQAREGAGKVRSAAEKLVRDATSAEADPEASSRARKVLASAAGAVALVVAVALLRRRGK